MPQLRSFSAYAPKPDFGSALIGGANVGRQSAATGANIAAELALGRERIQASMVQANMEAASKAQALQMQALRADQELKIQQAQQQAVLGLKQRELDQAQEIVNLKAQDAANRFAASQQYQQEAQALMQGGMEPDRAFMQAAMKFGPQMELPGSAYSQVFRQENGEGGADFGAAAPVEGLPDDYRQVQTGPASRRIIRLPESIEDEGGEGREIPGLPGKREYGGKVYTVKEPRELIRMEKRLERLETEHSKDNFGLSAFNAEKAGEELSKGRKVLSEAYKARASEIRALDEKVSQFGEKKPSGDETFDSSAAAREAGFEAGDVVRIKGVGKVRLK